MNKFRLMHYSANWNQEFEQTKSLLLWATEGWICEVCHIGGTAIEGSIASPTIDTVAGITSLVGLNEAATLIEGLHYRRLPTPVWCDEELVAWLVRPWTGHPTHTVLIARHGGLIWQQCLAIRQRLSNDYLLREKLEVLKREHFRVENSMETYGSAKDEFFQKVLHSDL